MANAITRQRSSGRAASWIAAGGLLVAVAAPMTLAAQSPQRAVSACAAGEEDDVFSGECVPVTAPMTQTNTGNYSADFSPTVTGGSANPDIPEVDGIPCTGDNTGECIALDINQVPQVQPHSSVSSSP
ncbi:MAG: intersectin-EH binding protein Ibp1 [Mycobacterium sp.]|nr:intersectin-EH binding protein Ibp1 [Mycobacterium sp.]